MAKIIVRAGKAAIKIIILFAILVLMFYSIKILTPARAQTEPAHRTLADEMALAETYQEQGQYAEAEQIYQDIIEQYPLTDYDLKATTQLAILYINSDRPADANSAVEELKNNFVEHPELTSSLVDISTTYRESDRYDEAVSLCEYILKNRPQDDKFIWAQVNLVLSKISQKDEKAAQAAFDQLLSEYSNNEQIFEAICEIALVYFCEQDRADKTVELFEYAMDNWPEHVWTNENEEIEQKIIFADSCVETGREQKALAVYQELLDKQPEGNQAVWLIEAYESLRISLGQDPNVQPIIDKFITEYLYEGNAPVELYGIGTSYELAGAKDKAYAVYQAILDNWSGMKDKIRVSELLILSEIALYDDPNVTEELDELIADFIDHPDLPDVILEIGGAYYRQGRLRAAEGDTEREKAFYRDAISIYERLNKEFADSEEAPTAFFRLGVLYAQELGEYQKGIDCFEAAVKNRPDYKFGGTAHSLIARYYKKLRDSGAISEAEANTRIKKEYQAVVENWPDCLWIETALLNLGRMCFAEGELVDSIMYYEMLLDRSPEKVCLVGDDLIAAYTEMGDVEMVDYIRTELAENNCPGR